MIVVAHTDDGTKCSHPLGLQDRAVVPVHPRRLQSQQEQVHEQVTLDVQRVLAALRGGGGSGIICGIQDGSLNYLLEYGLVGVARLPSLAR